LYKEKNGKFSLEYDTEIVDHPEALVVGLLATTGSNDNLLDSVPTKFNKSIHIMSTEAAKCLTEHKPYDHAIELKQDKNSPWGPCYTLSKQELEVFRESVKKCYRPEKYDRLNPLHQHQFSSCEKHMGEVYGYP
jgi:hypothetical protein